MKSQADSYFTPACPICRGEGVPREVLLQNQERTVTFVCSTCNRTWTATDPHPSRVIGLPQEQQRSA